MNDYNGHTYEKRKEVFEEQAEKLLYELRTLANEFGFTMYCHMSVTDDDGDMAVEDAVYNTECAPKNEFIRARIMAHQAFSDYQMKHHSDGSTLPTYEKRIGLAPN